MSVEWGALSEPTIPAPTPDEQSDNVRRAARSTDSVSLASFDHGVGNDHLSASHNGEKWLLPGGGDSGDRCEEWRPKAVCGDCGHVEMVEQRCDRWQCPNCWARAANRFSVNGASRMQSYRYMQPDDYHKQWAHAVVSADACDVDTKRKLFENRTKAADIAMEKGFRGCAVVPHAYRLSDLGERMYAEHVDRDEEGNPIVGKWVWLRNSSHELEYVTSELVSWEPHYHIIGPTSPNMTGAKESDEWRYSVIRFNEHDLNGIATSDDSHEELFGTFRYIASHIAFPEDTDRQLITWHGELANSVFVEDAIEEWQVQKPSQGAREAIKRRMKGLAGPMVDNDDSDGDDNESDDLGECPTDDCDGRLIAVWDINAYLDHADPPPDVVHRMRVARDWVAGDLEPPGGLKHPTCEQDARQVLNHLL